MVELSPTSPPSKQIFILMVCFEVRLQYTDKKENQVVNQIWLMPKLPTIWLCNWFIFRTEIEENT